jgi:hypothetical protein
LGFGFRGLEVPPRATQVLLSSSAGVEWQLDGRRRASGGVPGGFRIESLGCRARFRDER